MERITKIDFDGHRLLTKYEDLKKYKYAGSDKKLVIEINKPTHEDKCICGARIKINHYIYNEEDDTILVVGSTCMKIFEKIYGNQFKINTKKCAWCEITLDDNRKNHCDECKKNKDLICNETIYNDYGSRLCKNSLVKDYIRKCAFCDNTRHYCSKCFKNNDGFICGMKRKIKCNKCDEYKYFNCCADEIIRGTCNECNEKDIMNKRVYFDISYYYKEEAKDRGARWDPIRKKWYAEDNEKAEPIKDFGFKVINI